MLTAEIKVSGALIGHLILCNVTNREDDAETNHGDAYNGTWHDVGSDKVKRFTVRHRREKGAPALVAKAFTVIAGERE